MTDRHRANDHSAIDFPAKQARTLTGGLGKPAPRAPALLRIPRGGESEIPDLVAVRLVRQAAIGFVVDGVVDEPDFAVYEEEIPTPLVPAAEAPVASVVVHVTVIHQLRIEF